MAGQIIKTVIILLIAAGMSSCGNSNTRLPGPGFYVADSVPLSEAEKLSEEAVADIVQNIASPVEIASIIHSMNAPFSAEYLAPTRSADRLTTNFQKALMLGIFGADLGYLNIYEKTGSSVDMLSTIKRLADGLRVGHYFDFETIKRLSLSRTNLDSLLYLSVNSYNQIDKYLRNNNRGSISALMITGVWLEGHYLATQVALQYDDKILINRIGEQKVILGDLLLLLRPYRDQGAEYEALFDMMEELQALYTEVKVSYRLGEPETIEENGRLVMIQHEESIVEMSDTQLQKIASHTRVLRNKLMESK